MAQFRPGDGKYNLLWKLLEQAGGTPRAGDNLRDLLAKYLTAIGGTPVQGDHFMNLLAKVVIIKGGTPLPGDKEWDLLVKWLQTLGQCRACGDSDHNLWRKILAAEAFVVPFNVVLVKTASNLVNFSWEADRDPADHWDVQFIACDESGVPLFDVDRTPEDRDSFLVGPGLGDFPAGDWVLRIKDSNAPADAWVLSNCITFP